MSSVNHHVMYEPVVAISISKMWFYNSEGNIISYFKSLFIIQI